jgi:hypothetical protein
MRRRQERSGQGDAPSHFASVHEFSRVSPSAIGVRRLVHELRFGSPASGIYRLIANEVCRNPARRFHRAVAQPG